MKRLLLPILLALSCCAPAHAATQFDFLLSQVRTAAGGALVAGKVYFYSPGTTTPKKVWLDRGQSSEASNPYTLDANGTALVYGAGTYRVVIKDSGGVTRYDRDGVVAAFIEDGTITPIDCTSSDQTYLLPAGGVAVIVKTDATANKVTIQPSVGGQTINGLSSITLTVKGEVARLTLSGTTWYKD